MKATGVILAGGKSSRMGRDKALLPLGEETMLSRAVKELQKVFPEVIISHRKGTKYGIEGAREVFDIYTDVGPLAGLHASLREAKYHHVFFAACDMPFLDGNLAKFLVKQAQGYDIAIPKIASYLQPLFAVYTKNCLPHIEDSVHRNIKKVTGFYDNVKVNYVEERLIKQFLDPDIVFCNVNTPKEYKDMIKKITLEETCGIAKGDGKTV